MKLIWGWGNNRFPKLIPIPNDFIDVYINQIIII